MKTGKEKDYDHLLMPWKVTVMLEAMKTTTETTIINMGIEKDMVKEAHLSSVQSCS